MIVPKVDPLAQYPKFVTEFRRASDEMIASIQRMREAMAEMVYEMFKRLESMNKAT